MAILGSVASDIAGRIQELRAVTGLTQDGLGAIAGVNGRQVYSWEKGHAVPPRSRLVRMCESRGWCVEMFAEGGPRPRTCVNGPLTPSNERTRQEGYQAVFARAMAEVAVHLEQGTDMSPLRVMHWLRTLLAAVSPLKDADETHVVSGC